MSRFTVGLHSLMYVVFMWWCMDIVDNPANDNDNSRTKAIMSAIGVSAVYLYYGNYDLRKNEEKK